MNRFEYVSQHINAFQHEYKMLITGKMAVEQLPIESLQGILYHLLQQLMDCYDSLSQFYNHSEFIDEMIEDYNFDAYLGLMSRDDDKTYGIENMRRAADPLFQIMGILEDGEELMSQYTKTISGIVKSLFARLFTAKKEAIFFFGDEASFNKAHELWKSNKFMEALVESMILSYGIDCEGDRIQMLISDLLADPETLSNSIMEMADEDDLPFN